MAGHPTPSGPRSGDGTPGRAGSGQPSLRRAHLDSSAGLGAVSSLARAEREEIEDRLLAPGATRAVGAGDRPVEEEPDGYRTCFERDRDRILHSAAFRRLAGKTQVFIFPHDHQRTRLTHALEVAQVATAVARATRLNVALTEAIALGHDCGHGPCGHTSEDALSPYVPGGYEHSVWGADVVLAPKNLCSQTSDGIRNHSWSRPAPSTPEGEVVSWADRIAYVCHDFEDAVSAAIVTPDALPPLVSELCGTTRSEQLQAFIAGLVAGIATGAGVGMPEQLAEALAQFRRCNYERIYMRPESVAEGVSVSRVLAALVEHLIGHPELVPGDEGRPVATADPGSAEAARAAVTYVGGMTDRFAFARAVELLDWDPAALPFFTAPTGELRSPSGARPS
jgi:dGTPase